MRASQLQEKIETKLFECLEDIAEEIGLNIPFLPEVYFIGRNFKFETLGLSEKEREDYELVKKGRQSIFFHKQKIILIGTNNIEHISEEAGHFLHITNSHLTLYDKNTKDYLASWIIAEMLGYFSSKLINPDRKNPLNRYPDILNEEDKCMRIINKKGWDTEDFLIYQQGYNLGEKLFNAYISRVTSRRYIRNLFKNNLKGKNNAYSTFLKLRKRLL